MKINALFRYIFADRKLFKVLDAGVGWPDTQHPRNLGSIVEPLLHLRGFRHGSFHDQGGGWKRQRDAANLLVKDW